MRNLILFFASLVLSLPIFADTIHLHNGAIYSGEIIENIEGEYVRIKLDNGGIFACKYSEIKTINTGSKQIEIPLIINNNKDDQEAQEFKIYYRLLLNNGTIYVGEILDNVRGEYVRIKLADGGVFACKYSEIQRITNESNQKVLYDFETIEKEENKEIKIKKDRKNWVTADISVGYQFTSDDVIFDITLGWRKKMATYHYWDVVKFGYFGDAYLNNIVKLTTGYHFNYKYFYANASIGVGVDVYMGSAGLTYELGFGVQPLKWLTIGVNYRSQELYGGNADWYWDESSGGKSIVGRIGIIF